MSKRAQTLDASTKSEYCDKKVTKNGLSIMSWNVFKKIVIIQQEEKLTIYVRIHKTQNLIHIVESIGIYRQEVQNSDHPIVLIKNPT